MISDDDKWSVTSDNNDNDKERKCNCDKIVSWKHLTSNKDMNQPTVLVYLVDMFSFSFEGVASDYYEQMEQVPFIEEAEPF